VAGVTESNDFPTMNPLQTDLAGDKDVFIAKLNPSGNALIYSTYLGGSESDQAFDIAVDAGGNVYVVGQTNSDDFITADALQTDKKGGIFDAFIAKLNSSGQLIYSTYLGGSDSDTALGVAADGDGNAYLVGLTFSTDFP